MRLGENGKVEVGELNLFDRWLLVLKIREFFDWG